jgi:tetratricopeptide (TPR) repeat protein
MSLPFAYELFVSYARRDNLDGWVDRLVDAIREEQAQFTPTPLRCFVDHGDVETMDDWEHKIIGALRHSKLMLAVLSPAYFESAYCRKEWEAYIEHELGRSLPGEGIAPLYIVTIPGFEHGAPATLDAWLANLRRRQYLDLRDWRAEGPEALRRGEVRARLRGLEQRLSEQIQKVERIVTSPTTIPPHHDRFVGRTDELRRVREALAIGRVGAITAVHGLGGIGKSALAFEYAHAFAAEYPGGRFLVPCAGATDLRIPLVKLADAKGVPLTDEERKDLDASFARVRAAFERGPRSLLLLDNVDDPKLLSPQHRARCLPSSDDVHTLVTTRLEPERMRDIECLALDALPEADALRLLEKHRPFADAAEREAAGRIVRRLAGHPLAVEVVAVYLWQTPEVSYVGNAARLEREGLGALEGAARDDLVELSRHQQKLLTELLGPTLALLSPPERLALEYAALMPPEHVALPWLRDLVGKQFPEVATEPVPGYPDPWRQVERRLLGLRLLSAGDPNLARMHRVVRDVVAVRLGPDEFKERWTALTTLAMVYGELLLQHWSEASLRWNVDVLRNYILQLFGESREVMWSCIAHLIEPSFPMNLLLLARMLPIAGKAGISLPEVSQGLGGAALTHLIAGTLLNLGRYHEAHDLLLRTHALGEKVFPPGSRFLARTRAILGQILSELGDPREAKKHLLTAVESLETMGDTSQEMAALYSCLARVEIELGNPQKAQQLEVRVAHLLKVAGEDQPDHAPEIASSANPEPSPNSGPIAEAQRERPSTVAKEGMDLADLIRAKRSVNEALTARHMGNAAEARQRLRQIIPTLEGFFGPDHPELAVPLSNLALAEQDLDDRPEARRLLLRSIAIAEKSLGPDHPSLTVTYTNLGQVEQALGDLPAARRALLHAIDVGVKSLGDDHPDLAVSSFNLASVEQAEGHFVEASRLLRRTIEIEVKAYGPDHPTLLDSYSMLAENDLFQSRFNEARDSIALAVALQERTLAPDDPELAAHYVKLGDYECYAGNHVEAQRRYRQALPVIEEQFRLDGFILPMVYAKMADAAEAMNDVQEVRRLRHLIITTKQGANGPDKPEWADDYVRLAVAEQDLEHWVEARHWYRRAIEIQEVNPSGDRANLEVYSALAMLEEQLGDTAEAHRVLRRGIGAGERTLGPDHPRLADLYPQLALAERSRGNHLEARRLLLLSLGIWKKTPDVDPNKYALTQFCLADVEEGLGRHDEAIRLMQQLLIFCLAKFGPSSEATMEVANWLVLHRRREGPLRRLRTSLGRLLSRFRGRRPSE